MVVCWTSSRRTLSNPRRLADDRRPTDRPSFHFWDSLVQLYGVQLPLNCCLSRKMKVRDGLRDGINGRPSREEPTARIRKNRHCLQRSLNQNVFSSSFFRLFTLNYTHLLQPKVSDGRMVGHVQLPVPAGGPRHDRPSNESKFCRSPRSNPPHTALPTSYPFSFEIGFPS